MLTRLAILASGGGSNLEAIAQYLDSQGGAARARVAVVISDRSGAPALEKARARAIAAEHVHDPADAEELRALLARYDVDLVALAGYLRLIPTALVASFANRILNVHPALLPQFGGAGMYGSRVHEAVLASGARVSGVTVHLVNEEYDRGAILAQWPVPVLRGDSAGSLARRVLAVEHMLYPRVIHAVAAGRLDPGSSFAPVSSGSAAFMDAFTFGARDAETLLQNITTALSI